MIVASKSDIRSKTRLFEIKSATESRRLFD